MKDVEKEAACAASKEAEVGAWPCSLAQVDWARDREAQCVCGGQSVSAQHWGGRFLVCVSVREQTTG